MAGQGKSRADDMDHAANGRDREDPMSESLMLEMIRQLAERVARNEAGYADDRREDKRDRQDFRSEVGTGLTSLRDEIRVGFVQTTGAISKLHDRIDIVKDEGHQRENSAWGWRMKTMVWALGSLLGALAGVAGFALIQWLRATGVAG
jgi:hypothetical protein